MSVQLRRLCRIYLRSDDGSSVGCILSHTGYPESASVEARVSLFREADPPRAISRVFLCSNTDTARHLQWAKGLLIRVEVPTHMFSTHKLACLFEDFYPQGLSQAASKTLEVVGKDSMTFLCVSVHYINLTEEMWETFLHRLPQLERANYQRARGGRRPGVVNPFILVFSRPFEGGPVCPKLRRPELPKEVLTQDPSSAVLKCALVEREACDIRLRLIGVSHDPAEEGPLLGLETFQDFLDKVR